MELKDIINSRRQMYENYPPREVEYALNRLADGESIDPKRLKKTPLKELLISIDEVEQAIKKILLEIDSSENFRGYSFVVGDYGTGKTQLRDLLIDSTTLSHVIILKADLGMTSFGGFALDTVREIRDFLQKKFPDKMPSIESYLANIETSKVDAEIYQSIVKTFNSLATMGITTFLHLDEIDMIENFESFTPWANFIVMINQHVEQGLHIVFYMAPRDINRLWDRDSRLNRLSRYISKAISPGKSFGEKYVDGVGQLMAMYETDFGTSLNDDMLKILSRYLEEFSENLKDKSFRKLNTETFMIAEFLSNLQTKEVWKNSLQAFAHPTLQLANAVENAVNQILKEITIEVEFNDEIYNCEYDPQLLRFSISRIDEEEKIEVKEIKNFNLYWGKTVETGKGESKLSPEEQEAINKLLKGNEDFEISDVHSTTSDYSQKLKKIKSNIREDPVTLVMIGRTLKEVEKEFFISELAGKDHPDIQIISLNAELTNPLILYTHPSSASDFALKRQLKVWFELIGNVNQQLKPFFEKIIRQEYEIELQNQMEQLRAQMGNVVLKEVENEHSGFEPTSSRKDIGDQPAVSSLNKMEVEILLRIMVIYGRFTAKKKETLINEIQEDLHRNNITNILDHQVEAMVKRLIQKEFLKETSTQYRKNRSWNNRTILDTFNLK